MEDVVDVSTHAVAKDNDDVTVDATAGGVTLLAANAGRKSALIINTGSATMRVTTDGSAPTTTHGKVLPSGAVLTMSEPYCPKDAVKAIRTTTTSTSANASEVI